MIFLDTIQDDCCGLRRCYANLAVVLSPLRHRVSDLIVAHAKQTLVHAQRRPVLSHLLPPFPNSVYIFISPVHWVLLTEYSAGVDCDVRTHATRHHDRRLKVRCIEPEVIDQCFGESLDGKFGRTIGRMRYVAPKRCPESIDTAGIHNVPLTALEQHGQKRPAKIVDAVPADIECPLPLFPRAVNETAATTNTGIVEQQIDVTGLVLFLDLLPECLHLVFCGNIAAMGGYPDTLRGFLSANCQSLIQVLLDDVAGCHMATLCEELPDQFPPHAGSTTCDHGNFSTKVFHT